MWSFQYIEQSGEAKAATNPPRDTSSERVADRVVGAVKMRTIRGVVVLAVEATRRDHLGKTAIRTIFFLL